MRLLLLCLLCLSSVSRLEADHWPQYGGPTGDFRLPAVKTKTKSTPWKRAFGHGTSGIVADGKRLYTMYSELKTDPKEADEIVVALNPATGATLWKETTSIKMRPKQQTFRGAPLQPQSTPAVFDGRLFTLGFTGLLQGRDSATGKILWAVDLVADHAAIPVQFGFSASPILHDNKLIVHVGGKHALIAFEPKTGKVLWKSEAGEPSYATPAVMNWNKETYLVQLTRDTLLAMEPVQGATRWSFPLPTVGLTNVPTPIPLDKGRILVSGQGLEGTQLLQLGRDGDKVTVKTVWHQRRAQFFYTNWASDGERAYGFTGNSGKRFTALRINDGATVSREASQTDANVVLLGKELLLCRGDGLVSLGKMTSDGFESTHRGKPVNDRCWPTPIVLGDAVVVRSATELALVKLSSLTGDFKAPNDDGVSALDAAFRPQPKPKAKTQGK